MPKKKPNPQTVNSGEIDASSGQPACDFPIVGLGASAGGLGAFEAFFSGMPADADPGMAFVLLQHLAPDYKSMLAELTQRFTRLKVREAEALAMNVRERIPAELRQQALDQLVDLSRASTLEPVRTTRLNKQGRAVQISLVSSALLDETGRMYAVATTERPHNGERP